MLEDLIWLVEFLLEKRLEKHSQQSRGSFGFFEFFEFFVFFVFFLALWVLFRAHGGQLVVVLQHVHDEHVQEVLRELRFPTQLVDCLQVFKAKLRFIQHQQGPFANFKGNQSHLSVNVKRKGGLLAEDVVLREADQEIDGDCDINADCILDDFDVDALLQQFLVDVVHNSHQNLEIQKEEMTSRMKRQAKENARHWQETRKLKESSKGKGTSLYLLSLFSFVYFFFGRLLKKFLNISSFGSIWGIAKSIRAPGTIQCTSSGSKSTSIGAILRNSGLPELAVASSGWLMF